jgi:putative FmdB family regulatory protein
MRRKTIPIYSYECETCDRIMDVLCKYEEMDQPCPMCGQDMVRQLSAPAGKVAKGVYDEFL